MSLLANLAGLTPEHCTSALKWRSRYQALGAQIRKLDGQIKQHTMRIAHLRGAREKLMAKRSQAMVELSRSENEKG